MSAHCPNCGEETRPDDSFCRTCGRSLTSETGSGGWVSTGKAPGPDDEPKTLPPRPSPGKSINGQPREPAGPSPPRPPAGAAGPPRGRSNRGLVIALVAGALVLALTGAAALFFLLQVFAGDAPQVVPNVQGLQEQEARQQVESAGLEFSARHQPDPNATEGEVTAQDPAPGTELEAGAAVRVTVATAVAQAELYFDYYFMTDMTQHSTTYEFKAEAEPQGEYHFEWDFDDGSEVYVDKPAPGETSHVFHTYYLPDDGSIYPPADNGSYYPPADVTVKLYDPDGNLLDRRTLTVPVGVALVPGLLPGA